MTTSEIRNEIQALFEKWTGTNSMSIIELPLSGSNRKYFRISDGKKTVIATYNSDFVENEAFFYLVDRLGKSGVNVPQLYISDETKGIYLQEDLGDLSLYDYAITNSISDGKLFEVYKKVIDQMPLIQYESAQGMDFSKCFPREAFDRQSIQWDLNYFKYCFLKLVQLPFHEQKLEDEFQKLIELLLEAPSDFFLFRDFQSRNIMLKNEKVFFIDFQGGRRGALQYDLASLIYEAKTNLNASFRERILNYYIEVYSKYDFFDKEVFLKYYPAYALIRILQAFGAYGYRGLFEKKAFFVQSISSGLKNILELSNQTTISERFPYLCELVKEMQSLGSKFDVQKTEQGLTITVASFSYMNGLPDDWSGNGGGYVFDCRALNNPGRHEEYKALTGRDAEVISFLNKDADVKEFIARTQKLVEKSVKKYIERGFKHLSVAYGCTGGQHRSVYAADQLIAYLKLNFDVHLRLFHREQKIEEFYDKNNVQKE
jgi:aminoglycoside/choline kinase family phosphotransferase